MKLKSNSTAKYLMTLSVVIGGIAPSLSMEAAIEPEPTPPQASTLTCDLSKPHPQEEGIPSGYVRCNIAQQMKYYREKVYDVALQEYGGNVEDLKTKPIAGLSVVLENAFALVNDYIQEDKTKTEDYKNKYKNALRELWDKAKDFEGKLTSKDFQKLNLDLAIIAEGYNHNEDPSKTSNFQYSLRMDQVIFVIYGNPDPKIKARHISPFHFVDQFFAEPYSAYIAFFDILSVKPVKQTRKDPHWSAANGTASMLIHDYGHAEEQDRDIGNKNKYPELKNSIKKIYDIQKKYKETGHNNEATILMDALFMIIHEEPAYAPHNYDNFKNLTKLLKEHFMWFDENIDFDQNEYAYGSAHYKEIMRDAEFVLKDKYFDTQANQFKPVHDGQGKPFLPITYDPANKKMTRPFGDVSPLGDTNPATIKKRKQLMLAALNDGYNRYWDYVLYLIENPPR